MSENWTYHHDAQLELRNCICPTGFIKRVPKTTGAPAAKHHLFRSWKHSKLNPGFLAPLQPNISTTTPSRHLLTKHTGKSSVSWAGSPCQASADRTCETCRSVATFPWANFFSGPKGSFPVGFPPPVCPGLLVQSSLLYNVNKSWTTWNTLRMWWTKRWPQH